MRSLITYFVKNPVLVTICTLLIILLGVLSLSQLRFTFFPKSYINFIDISVVYRGASPEEVEEGVINKIEENLQGITGVDRFTSSSMENRGTVAVELEEGASVDVVLQDVNNAVDRITTFPDNIDAPVVTKREILNNTITYALTGDQPLQVLNDYAEEMKDDLLAKKGLSKIFVEGVPNEEIEIRIRENDLRAYNLTFAEVAQAVRNTNLETSGGEIETDEKSIQIRANEKGYYAKDLQNIVVRATADGKVIRLKDIADVADQFKDDPVRRYISGSPSVTLRVYSLNEEDIVENADYVKDYMQRFNQNHDNVQAMLIEDSTVNLQDRVSTLSNNGVVGMILVLIVLGLFLDRSLAFWVALKIPVALLGMLVLGSFYDLTINVVSMFGAIIVLGILVDDGVVVSENIYRHYKEMDKDPIQAAVDGTMEVLPAVFSSLTTTAVAFSLFFFVDGTVGDFFSDVSFVVVATLMVAMVESFFFLPAHIAHSNALTPNSKQTKIEKAFNNSMTWFRDHIYEPFLNIATRRLGLMVVIALVSLAGAFALVGTGTVSVVFFPNVDQDVTYATLELPPGTNKDITLSKLQEIEAAIWRVNEQYSKDREDSLQVVQKIELIMGPDSHEGYLNIVLLGGETRGISSFEISKSMFKNFL